MMLENQQVEYSELQWRLDDLKRKKETIKGDQGDPLTVKSDFFLELKYSEWMNNRTYLSLVRLGPFYREFRVGLLVRCH